MVLPIKHSFFLSCRSCETPRRKIWLWRENVQQQERGDDCGPFALANLVKVLDGRDLRKSRFDQQKMRMHLFKCLWEKFQNQPLTVLRVDTADCFKSFSIRYFYVLGDTWTKIILLLIIGPNQQPITEQLTMTIWHYCYILFQLYECYKRLGQLLLQNILLAGILHIQNTMESEWQS